jgi:probable phosphoglycerate mutase
MPTIILIRHGETHWNREKRAQGQGDSPLTLKGIAQAQAYGRTVAELVGSGDGWAVHASPLPRCKQTAAILCETVGLPYAGIHFDPRLMEVGTGAWSGLLKSELPEAVRGGTGVDSWYFRAPGGERYGHMETRIGSWLAERQAGEKVIVVSHGIAGKVLRGLYQNLPADQALAGDSPQDALFVLANGSVERKNCA